MARNCDRREAISVGVKPAVSRRSKPRGAGVVVAVLEAASSWVDGEAGSVRLETSLEAARAASAARSAGERGSEMEQWM